MFKKAVRDLPVQKQLIVTMNNKSHNDNSQLFREASWMVVYICEAFLILAGNFITIYIFWSIRKRLKRTSYLLINLAVADILVGIALILWLFDGIAAMTGSDINKTVNKTATVVDTLGLMASISSLALISLEREWLPYCGRFAIDFSAYGTTMYLWESFGF